MAAYASGSRNRKCSPSAKSRKSAEYFTSPKLCKSAEYCPSSKRVGNAEQTRFCGECAKSPKAGTDKSKPSAKAKKSRYKSKRHVCLGASQGSAKCTA